MSDSVNSTVTYTELSSPFEDLSNIGSPRVMVYGYDRLLMHPPSLDYVPGPEHPSSPDYFMPPEHDVLLAEDQLLPAVVSPITNSPGYINEFDLEEDPKEEDDKDPEEDPADYPTHKDNDEEEEESIGDDANNKEEDEDEDEEEEEEHLALADFVPPPQTVAATLPFPSPPPPPSPLTSYSSPLPHIPSPPLPVSPTHPLGYRAAMIRLRAESPSNSHLLPLPPPIVLPHTRASIAMMRVAAPSTYILAPRLETPTSGTPPPLHIPLPTSSPPLLLTFTDRRADVLEVTLHLERGCKLLSDPDLRSRSVHLLLLLNLLEALEQIMEDPYEILEEIPTTDVAKLSQRMTDFVTTVRQDTDEIYKRLDDAHDDRLLMSGQLNSLRRDIRSHARTSRLIESKARASCEAWVQSMDASDTECSEMTVVRSQLRPARDPPHLDVPNEAEIAPKRTTRSSPATATTSTILATDAQLKALIDQGVANVLAARDADRSQNGEDNHDSRTGVRREAPLARTLSIGPIRNERIIEPTEGAIRKRFYKAQFLTLGSANLICQEEGWIISNVHRLLRTNKQAVKNRYPLPRINDLFINYKDPAFILR
nr:hypothetical protein [Tanacetum cinerariifolium]